METGAHRQAVVIGLGSNLGDRLDHLCFAAHELGREGVPLHTVSSVVETPPVGYSDQPPFLNLVALASSDLPPRRLLAIFHSVEERRGRERPFPNAPRTLDVDLLFFKDRILREPGLRVPHPRWKERSFVVRPLAEIAPGLRDPETGWTVHEVALGWPCEPREIRIELDSEAFRKACKEWKR